MVLKSFHTATTDVFLCNAMTVQPRMECKDIKRKLVIIIALPPHTATVVIQGDRTPLGVYYTVDGGTSGNKFCESCRLLGATPFCNSLFYNFPSLPLYS